MQRAIAQRFGPWKGTPVPITCAEADAIDRSLGLGSFHGVNGLCDGDGSVPVRVRAWPWRIQHCVKQPADIMRVARARLGR